jgi:hypothetical protein
MRTNQFSMCLGLALGLVTSAGSAATLTMTATPVGRFDDAFNPLSFDSTSNPGVYKIDLAFSISNLAANEKGWGALAFDVDLGGLTATIGWQRDYSTIDIWPLPFGVIPKFATNLDAGPSATDLQRIIVAIPSGLTGRNDPRTKLGQSGPEFIGSLYLKFDGIGGATMSIRNLGFLTTELDGRLNTTEQPAIGPSVTFGAAVPEPATLLLLALTTAFITCCRPAGHIQALQEKVCGKILWQR